MLTQTYKNNEGPPTLERKIITIGLCGNPNSGKTSIFNALTGSRQHVGNWSGVTVSKKEGTVICGEYEIHVVDLPGTYSLTAYSMEEIVTRDFIIQEKPDVIVNIIDSTNLERNLYLTTQLIELGAKVVVALNMSDEAEHKGIQIDKKVFSKLLGMAIVNTVGTTGKGLQELIQKVIEVAENKEPVTRHLHLNYSNEVEREIKNIQTAIRKNPKITEIYSTRWLSVKLLEHDQQMEEVIKKDFDPNGEIIKQVKKSHDHVEQTLNDESEIIMADGRYGFINGLLQEVYQHRTKQKLSASDRIDKVLTNRYLGIPILLGFLWVMFQSTFVVGQYPMGWIDSIVSSIAGGVSYILPNGLVKELIVDGIIGGVGGILIFLPNILILYFFISLFEDTGYMARAAFIMDRVMHTVGLHGKSFIPMIMGFGCNIPSIMATKNLENKSDRMLTIMINPFMSCSARLPVYILLTGAFFGAQAGNVIFLMYLTGIVLAIVVGRILRKTIFKGESAPFVMELPPYRIPRIKSVLMHMWEKGSIFLKKIGGIILAASILMWFISAFPRNTEITQKYDQIISTVETQYTDNAALINNKEELATLTQDKDSEILRLLTLKRNERMYNSYAGKMGQSIEPVLRPLGIDWKGGIALIIGALAKELVVSTFGVLYQAPEGSDETSSSLKNALRNEMTPLSALAFMFFTLIYIPCLGTIATMYRELGSLKLTVFSVVYSLTLAWVISFAIYQGGTLLGFGA